MTDVRLTATNPEDSSVVPVACNEKGELKLEEPTVSSDLYVAKAGDTMTGNLHLGDNITLNPDGSAQFAGGNIDVFESGKVIYGGDKITLDGTSGSAEFAGGLVEVRTTGTVRKKHAATGDTHFIDVGTTDAATYINSTSSGSAPTKPLQVFTKGGTKSYNYEFSIDGSFNLVGEGTLASPRISLNANGSAQFAGQINCNSVIWTDRFGTPVQVGASSTDAFRVGSEATGAVILKYDGSAQFAGDVVIGSRGDQWMIVESNGIAHLVKQTRSDEISTADLVDGQRPVEHPPLRDVLGELTMVEQQLQKVLEKLQMTPEAGWLYGRSTDD